ncbi:MAG: hypothetical protein JWR22_4057 [Herminiimonas sp.]|nr:hypothetical protein [Herminiimonas sp.]
MNVLTAAAWVALITTLFAAVLYWVPAPQEKDAAFSRPTSELMKSGREQILYPPSAQTAPRAAL